SEGVLAKNDPIDAQLIERFANAKRPPADPLLCREHIALRETVVHRRQLIESMRVFRVHRQQIQSAALGQEIDKSMAALKKRIKIIETKLREMINAHRIWKEKFDLLTSVKGVGLVTAVVIIAKMPELGSLNRGQSAALE